MAAARKNEVRDAEGRQRFHGAFTGGFSAGYFNTVGSKEGWAPAAFSSSRASKRALADASASASTSVSAAPPQRTARDYMDDEDVEQILGGALAAQDAYGGVGVAAAKRGRDIADAATTASSSSSSSSLLSSLIPSELIVPVSTPVGKLLLQECGWREGQALGPRRAGKASADGAELAAAEAELSALWALGTTRPPTARYGLGYDPQPLREREDAATTLLRQAESAAGLRIADAARPRLHMAAALGAGAGAGAGAGGGSGGSAGGAAPLPALAGRGGGRGVGGLVSFTLQDEDGEDDLSVYRQPSLLDYDIASSRARTGLDDERRRAGPGKLARLTDAAAAAASAGAERRASAGAPRPLALTDAAAAAEPVRPDPTRFCADGRPPLPGFHLAQRVERGVVEYAEAHRPVPPPPGWDPRHRFDAAAPQPEALYARFRYRVAAPGGEEEVGRLVAAARDGAAEAEADGGRRGGAAAADTGPLSADAFRSRFTAGPVVGAGAGSEGESTAPASSAAAKEAPAATLPAIGGRVRRTESDWAPARLLLRRLGVRDPLSKAERERQDRAEGRGQGGGGQGTAAAASAAGISSTGPPPSSFSSAPLDPEAELRRMLDQATAAGLAMRTAPALPPAPELARMSATLHAASVARPPASLLEALFGGLGE
jgi:G patch domain-containing protein 1